MSSGHFSGLIVCWEELPGHDYLRSTILVLMAAASCAAQAPLIAYRGISNSASRVPAGLPMA